MYSSVMGSEHTEQIIVSTYVRTLVIMFFIGNEGLSVIENLALMGIPCPPSLKKMLEVMRDKGADVKQIKQTARTSNKKGSEIKNEQ